MIRYISWHFFSSLVVIYSLAGSLGLTGLGRANNSPKTITQPAVWYSIPLPFRSVCIASSGNVLWVAGVDEMLAKSEDGGHTWQVKHQKVDGEILLAVRVLGEKIVYASGTNGILVLSENGGESWKELSAGSERVIDIALADSLHGIRESHSRVEITKDGGAHWDEISIMKTDEKLIPYSNVLGIAATDATHFAMLLNKTQGENLFLSTQDGGETWKPIHLEDTYAWSLFTQGGAYWALGIEIVER